MTNPPSAADAALYANHRRFLQAQRGALTRHTGFDAIAGDVPAFQIAMLHDGGALAEAARLRPTLFAPPWAPVDSNASDVNPPEYLLTHMSLASEPAPESLPGFHIAPARDEMTLKHFTTIQTAGFEPDAAKQAALLEWFWRKNLAAYREPDQNFLILYRGIEPVSVLACVTTESTLGIYAVATPPELRRRGYSTHLLRSACADARRAGAEQICLQVVRGSDAERLYAKLGFRERFIVVVHKSRHF